MDAFHDPAVIRRWFGWDYDGLADEIRSVFGEEMAASEAARTLHIGGHLFTSDDQGPQTVVRVARAAPVGASAGTAWAAYYDDIDEGWLSFLQQLRFVLARHPRPDDGRRSVYRSGESRAAEPSAAVELLGLGGVGSSGPYTATTTVGDVLSGEVWFRSERQLGLGVLDVVHVGRRLVGPADPHHDDEPLRPKTTRSPPPMWLIQSRSKVPPVRQ